MNYKWTTRLSFLTPVLLLAAIFLIGGGHGWYEPAISLFPFGMLGVLSNENYTASFFLLAIMQLPVYGFIFDFANRSGYQRTAIIVVTLIHIAVAMTIIYRMSALGE
jgi:hypothetical protein